MPNLSGPARGVIIMATAMVVLPTMDIIAKILSQSMASGQAAWSRFAFQVLYLWPLMWFLRPRVRSGGDWPLHALRGMLIALATLLFFTALRTMPVADALAIFFVEPFFLTLLSSVFLGEKIGWRRIGASLLGFAGALIVIKPGSSVFGWTTLLPLAAALCFAFYLILTRKLAMRTNPIAVQYFTGVSGLITMTVAMIIGTLSSIDFLTFSMPGPQQLGLMAALGAVGTVGHLLVVLAFRYLDASVLAPFQYLEIVSAVILGWYFFNDFPGLDSWLGIAIIVSSGVYVYCREQYLKSRSANTANV